MAEQAEQPELRVYLCRPGGALGALRGLLGRALASGSRAVIFAPSEGLDDLDRELWLGPEGKLLPHGVEGRGEEGRQPILLAEAGRSAAGAAANEAELFFCYLAAEAELPPVGSFARGFLVLQEGGLGLAERATAAGYRVSTWTQEDDGRWQEAPSG